LGSGDLLNELGQRKGATVSQVALAWVLSLGSSPFLAQPSCSACNRI
jgi:aryl-alcohol dehydrogenase-like predicted oxidoreductase